MTAREYPRTRLFVAAAVVAATCFADCRPAFSADDPQKAPRPKPQIIRRYRVYFGTNRRPEKTNDGVQYGAKSGPLTLGCADVTIAKGFDITSRQGIVVQSMRTINSLKSAKPQRGDGKKVLIFVHGFNVAFEESIQRIAQIAHEYDYRGTILVYSWPSLCKLGKPAYDADRIALDGSGKEFRQFLHAVSARFSKHKIQVLAHSLACRLVATTAVELSKNKKMAPIRWANLIFVAPDVDAKHFHKLYAQPLTQLAARATVYYSRSDWLLGIARGLNNDRDRLGNVGTGVRTRKRVEAVDYSALGGLWLAHNFYREHVVIVNDVRGVLAGTVQFSANRRLVKPAKSKVKR